MSLDTLEAILKRLDEHLAHKEAVSSKNLMSIKDDIVQKLNALEVKVERLGQRMDIANGRTAKNELTLEHLELKHTEQVAKMQEQIMNLSSDTSVIGNRLWKIVEYVILAVIGAVLALVGSHVF